MNRSIGFQLTFASTQTVITTAGGQQQERLDDLHPARGEHAAEHDVGDHERAGQDHREREVDVDETLDQHARADHLRDQVEGDDGQRAERRGRPRRLLLEPEGEHVGDRVLARVAHPLGEQEQDRQEGDQEADGVQEAVEAEQVDQAADAEERSRRHVVAGDGEAVLRPGQAAPRRPEVGGGVDALGGDVAD